MLRQFFQRLMSQHFDPPRGFVISVPLHPGSHILGESVHGDPVLFLDAPTLFVPEKDDYTDAFSIFVKVCIRLCCYVQVLSKYSDGCTILVAVNQMNWIKVTYVHEPVFMRRDFSFFRKLYDLVPTTIQGTIRTVYELDPLS